MLFYTKKYPKCLIEKNKWDSAKKLIQLIIELNGTIPKNGYDQLTTTKGRRTVTPKSHFQLMVSPVNGWERPGSLQ